MFVQREVKILFLRIFEDFDPPLEWTYFVKNDQTQQKYINFGKFSEHLWAGVKNIKNDCVSVIFEFFTVKLYRNLYRI